VAEEINQDSQEQPVSEEVQEEINKPLTVEEAHEKFEAFLEGDEAEVEAPPEEEGQAEPEAETQAEQEQEKKYVLPFGDKGEDVEISASELNNYLLRQQDYTRKTQALSEERKQLEEQKGNLGAIHQLSEQLKSEYDALRAVDNEEISAEYWNQLKAENPVQYLVERNEFQERRLEREQAERRVADLQNQLQQQQSLEQQQRLENEAEKLQEIIPEWQDNETANREREALKVYGTTQGYSEQELGSVTDSRAVSILRKAMLYDALQSKRSEIKQRVDKSPASAQAVRAINAPVRKRTTLQRHQQQLKKSGKLKDATSVFENLLNA
tara:strand:- start:21938 stop:22912 length:975 start_codon:yes stop_codon:yes gene_type:complete